MTEFLDGSVLGDKAKVEKGFRGIFNGFDAIEDFVRYSRYPNITIHPIAIYRSFKVSDSV